MSIRPSVNILVNVQLVEMCNCSIRKEILLQQRKIYFYQKRVGVFVVQVEGVDDKIS